MKDKVISTVLTPCISPPSPLLWPSSPPLGLLCIQALFTNPLKQIGLWLSWPAEQAAAELIEQEAASQFYNSESGEMY